MRARVGTKVGAVIAALGWLSLTVYGARSQNTQVPQTAPAVVPAHSAGPSVLAFPHTGDRMTAPVQTSMVQTICMQCHTDRRKPGGVSFEHLSMDEIARDGELAERMIAKLRAGLMPPTNAPTRPDESSIHAFVVALEDRTDLGSLVRP